MALTWDEADDTAYLVDEDEVGRIVHRMKLVLDDFYHQAGRLLGYLDDVAESKSGGHYLAFRIDNLIDDYHSYFRDEAVQLAELLLATLAADGYGEWPLELDRADAAAIFARDFARGGDFLSFIDAIERGLERGHNESTLLRLSQEWLEDAAFVTARETEALEHLVSVWDPARSNLHVVERFPGRVPTVEELRELIEAPPENENERIDSVSRLVVSVWLV
jgi:hypothetical protein